MKNWKTKLVGDTNLSFCGWLFTGLMVYGGSAYFVKRGLSADQYLSAPTALLVAIYIVLLGCFGLILHNYLARVAEKLDAPKKDTTDDHDR